MAVEVRSMPKKVSLPPEVVEQFYQGEPIDASHLSDEQLDMVVRGKIPGEDITRPVTKPLADAVRGTLELIHSGVHFPSSLLR